MTEYINKQTAIDVARTSDIIVTFKLDDEDNDWAILEQTRDAIAKRIEELPSADAVEIVRCKDCKYGRYIIADRGMYCGRKNVMMDTYEDDFCSYGERKDG